jgi:hypothetical protein
MLHDEWVLFLAGIAGPIQLIADPLVLYRQHEDNLSGWFERKRLMTLRPLVDDYQAAATYTSACASFLETARVEDPGLVDRVRVGALQYRRLAERWSLRANLYSTRSRARRAWAVARLFSQRAYGSRTSGGFGPRALGKDLVAGVGLRTSA